MVKDSSPTTTVVVSDGVITESPEQNSPSPRFSLLSEQNSVAVGASPVDDSSSSDDSLVEDSGSDASVTTQLVLTLSLNTSRPVSNGSAASSQAIIIYQPSQQPVNNPMPARPRSSRNRAGGCGGYYSSWSHQPYCPMLMPPPFYVFPYGMIPVTPIGGIGVGGGVYQSNRGNNHSSWRTWENHRPRPHPGGGRLDQDLRVVPYPIQYAPPPMVYMPFGAALFMAPPPMRPFPGQMWFNAAYPYMYAPPMPYWTVPPPPPMLYPVASEADRIVKQIDFYFSDDNLVKDMFLRSNMDEHGWVPINLIASFPRVQQLTKDISLILECLRTSEVVEVQGNKIRRHDIWHKWLLPAHLNCLKRVAS